MPKLDEPELRGVSLVRAVDPVEPTSSDAYHPDEVALNIAQLLEGQR